MTCLTKLILRAALTVCLLVGATANAETMSAAEFDAYTKAKRCFLAKQANHMGQSDIWKIVGFSGHFWMASARMVIGMKRRARFASYMRIKTRLNVGHLKKVKTV